MDHVAEETRLYFGKINLLYGYNLKCILDN